MALAAQMPYPEALSMGGPTQRPTESVLAGVNPNPGLSTRRPDPLVAQTFARLAAATGDQLYANLAANARTQGF